MRQDYRTTPQTIEALEGDVKAIADEATWTLDFLYKMMAGEKRDPYAPFRYFFRCVARAAPHKARIYLDDLRAMFERANGKRLPDPNDARRKATDSIFKLLGEEVDRLSYSDKIPVIRTAIRNLEQYEKALMHLGAEDSEDVPVTTGRAS